MAKNEDEMLGVLVDRGVMKLWGRKPCIKSNGKDGKLDFWCERRPIFWE